MKLRPHNRAALAAPRGLTIIELAVVILLAVAMITASISMIGALLRADLRTDSEKIVASIRYLYNLSVLNNRAYRLVIDQSEGRYWGEEFDNLEDGPCGAFLLEADDAAKPKRRATSTGRRADDETEAVAKSQNSFTKVKNHLLRKRSISNRVKFDGVLTEGQQDRIREGQVSIHFFPSGYVEHAFIYLSDGVQDGSVFTVETHPLLGSGKLYREELREGDFYVDKK